MSTRDRWVASAFCAALAQRGLSVNGRYWQVGVPRWRAPGGWWPAPGFAPRHGAQVFDVPKYSTWTDEVIARSQGAILVGGGRASLDIARSFLEADKPVFPIPFTGGYSDAVFRDILRTWSEQPVPGLSKAQFTRLAWPWLSGTGPLLELLRAVFDERPSIFVSYRRADSETSVGRLYRDLADQFGARRIFVDTRHIGGGDDWRQRIDGALETCRVGIVVIGPTWAEAMKDEARGVLRSEVDKLLAASEDPAKRLMLVPLLVEGAVFPPLESLPAEVGEILEFQARSLTNGNWDAVVDELVGQLRTRLGRDPLHVALSQSNVSEPSGS